MGVRSLGYLRLESTDVDAWKVFGGDFLGMMPVEGADPDSLYFRLDHYPPRLVVEPGAENRAKTQRLKIVAGDVSHGPALRVRLARADVEDDIGRCPSGDVAEQRSLRRVLPILGI